MPSFAALLETSGKAERSQKTTTPKPYPETNWTRDIEDVSVTGRYDPELVPNVPNSPSFEKDTWSPKTACSTLDH